MIEEINKLLEDGKFDEGLSLLNKLLESDQYNIELLSLKGKVLRHLKEYHASIDIYNALANLLPNEAEIYADRGLCYHSASEQDAALSDFSKAIELEPTNGYRYASRAFIRNFYGDHAGALDDYDMALELDPEDAISLNNKGMIEENMGREKAAIKTFMKADKLTGVDKKLEEIKDSPIKPPPAQLTAQKTSSLDHFIQTLKGLLNSKEERKSFFKFLGKK